MKTSVLFACLVLACTCPAFAQYDQEAKVVLDAMSSKYKKYAGFTANFSQNLKNETAGIDERIEGTIHVKGDKYKLEIGEQEVYNDGQNTWAYNKEAMEVSVINNEDNTGGEISLNNIYTLYREGYKYVLLAANDNGNRVVDLDPIDREGTSYYKIRMLISQDDELRGFIVFEDTGNQYRYTIQQFTPRTDLTDDFFQFDPANYPGVEVIDFR